MYLLDQLCLSISERVDLLLLFVCIEQAEAQESRGTPSLTKVILKTDAELRIIQIHQSDKPHRTKKMLKWQRAIGA